MRFPIGQEEFIRQQEKLSQRTLEPTDRDLLLAWLDVFNDIYMCGRENDTSTRNWLISRIEQRRQYGSLARCRFLDAASYWAKKAWQQGYKEAQHENH